MNNLKTGSVICVPDTENTYVYVVRPGDSVYMIAKRFNVPVERILRVNYMNAEDIILPGIQLVIPFKKHYNGIPADRTMFAGVFYLWFNIPFRHAAECGYTVISINCIYVHAKLMR